MSLLTKIWYFKVEGMAVNTEYLESDNTFVLYKGIKYFQAIREI